MGLTSFILMAISMNIISALEYDRHVMLLDKKNFKEEIKNRNMIVVEFTATWCDNCPEFSETFQIICNQLNQSYV
jgi:thiol-disulfide isomerase/thioredoxin